MRSLQAVASDVATAPARDEARITPASNAWLIVQTKAHKEGWVRDNLRRQGFEVYLPLRALDELQAKKRGVAAVPLFPRILFARATLDAERWQVIFNTFGVQRVMCDPRQPRGVKGEFVERIRDREVAGFVKLGLRDPSAPPPTPEMRDPRKWVKLGDVVDGLLNKTIDESRGAVLVSLLNGNLSSLTQDLRKL